MSGLFVGKPRVCMLRNIVLHGKGVTHYACVLWGSFLLHTTTRDLCRSMHAFNITNYIMLVWDVYTFPVKL